MFVCVRNSETGVIIMCSKRAVKQGLLVQCLLPTNGAVGVFDVKNRVIL